MQKIYEFILDDAHDANDLNYKHGLLHKTLGSVLCGLVDAHECTLLVIICVYDAKNIQVDALGTLRTTGTRSL
jgi:hypothetical protein